MAEAKKHGCAAVTFSYTEPVVFFEYVQDVAVQARAQRLVPCLCSALYVHKEPLKDLLSTVRAVAGSLKGFDPAFYERVVGCKLAPVLDALVAVKEAGAWLEVVCLVIPTVNDDRKDLAAMCAWIVKNLGKDTPVHFARFVPAYKMKDLPRTPIKTLEEARDLARAAGSRYAYIANLPGHEGNNTWCPGCKEVVIERLGFKIQRNTLRGGACGKCGTAIPGIWA